MRYWVASYARNGVMRDQHFETSEEAYAFLNTGEKAGTLSSHSIISPNDNLYLPPRRGGSTLAWEKLGRDVDFNVVSTANEVTISDRFDATIGFDIDKSDVPLLIKALEEIMKEK